jgi:hypothetical protein
MPQLILHTEREVKEIAHFTNEFGDSFIIINQDCWYSTRKYTDETAIARFLLQ